MALECAGVINFTPQNHLKDKSEWLNGLIKDLAKNNNMSELEVKVFIDHE